MKAVRSVERALSILTFICRSPAPLGLSEISRATGFDKATTRRLLVSLAGADMVQQDMDTRAYLAGAGISQLYASLHQDLRTVCRPHLQTLMNKVQETACLFVPRGVDRVCIDVVHPSQELCIRTNVGSAMPLTRGASGRLFMAYRSDEECRDMLDGIGLPQLTAKSLTDRDGYLDAIRQVRRQGYAYSSNDAVTGSASVAAPVFDDTGAIVAAIAVRGPSSRMTRPKASVITPSVVATAALISRRLGFAEGRQPAT